MFEVNFFWRGKDFNFLHSIVIKSHINIGHQPIIWISGQIPTNNYWYDIANKIKTKNADDICNVDQFITTGGNERTAADLWRFNFLYKHGGLYCDTDAFALKQFPDDDWIVCSAQNNTKILSIGVLKAPKHQKLFSECIENIRKDWYNNNVFTESYKKFLGHTNPTHDNLLFYPYKWQNCHNLFNKILIPNKAYSIHFYGAALEIYVKRSVEKNKKRLFHFEKIKKLNDYNEEWCRKNSDTLLGRLYTLIKEN